MVSGPRVIQSAVGPLFSSLLPPVVNSATEGNTGPETNFSVFYSLLEH